ncbi:putative invertase inhibitor [Vitis vinifera]|uniref:Putative invertase inhibitor n=1 Tax=Vitis vinifera TaxID=29760 RepID=A0A438JWH2_VITVI|nr:putative invertase inhibitor [Vitis vinifera]
MAMAMAHPLIPAFFLLIIPLLFLTHSLSPAHAASELVDGVCHESQNYSFCIQALESDPKTPAAKDYMDLAVISLNLGISNTTDTRSYINDLYESPETDPSKKPALKGCISGYDGAVGSFKSALGELKEDALTANYDAKVAGDGAVSCEDQLASGGVKDSSISARNQFTLSLSNIADVITTHLLH